MDPFRQIPFQRRYADLSLLKNLTWGNLPGSHKQLAKILKSKSPYTITVILENLDPKFWNRKDYVKKTKIKRISRYRELLYQYFNETFDTEDAANDQYGKWLDRYRSRWLKEKQTKDLDDYIIKYELEPRYLPQIKQRFKDLTQLKKPRFYLDRNRYYHLPEPLNFVDWRAPFDNLFIWTDGQTKFVVRGGSGSSGARENNSRFIFALGLLNRLRPVASHLFVYNRLNRLQFLRHFPDLTVPRYDLGSNYHLETAEEKRCLRDTRLIYWENLDRLKKLYIN